MIGLGKLKSYFAVWVYATVVFDDCMVNLHNLQCMAQEVSVPLANETDIQRTRRVHRQRRFSREYEHEYNKLITEIDRHIESLESGETNKTLFKKRDRQDGRTPEQVKVAISREIVRLQKLRARVAKNSAAPARILRRSQIGQPKRCYRDPEGIDMTDYWQDKLTNNVILSVFEYCRRDVDILETMTRDKAMRRLLKDRLIETADSLWKLGLVHEYEEMQNEHVADVNLRMGL